MAGYVINCKSHASYIHRNRLTFDYFEDIRRYSVLTNEQTRVLFEKYRNGNPKESKDARDKLINCNQRFVVSAARKWSNGLNIMDLIIEGNIGLSKAIDKYNESKGASFITYAVFWIRKALKAYVSKTEKMVNPLNSENVNTYVRKARNKFFITNGREATDDEISDMILDEYGVVLKREDVMDIMMTSIDKPVSDEADSDSFGEVNCRFSEETQCSDTSECASDSILSDYLKSEIRKLPKLEYDVICKIYGIGCAEMSLKEIGEMMGICSERVRQIRNSALKKLKVMINKEINF